ncbi:MAG TPA: DNA polymerase IV [Gammaproteobacteria bacterium]|nr:DNA polymerase IV [Gammaproteobacteria bacterium]
MARLIAHVDMDAFYASVEQHDYPELQGKPVIVGGTGRRSVVCAASYEAREFGVRSAMPGYEAHRRCPDGVYLPVRMARYREVSQQVFQCFAEFTSLIEGLSLDEAFLDMSAESTSAEPLLLGRTIKARIRAQTGLNASVGLGPNKLVAKIASDRSKPDGLLHIRPAEVQTMLDPLPVTALWGIGPRTGAQLEQAGIGTINQLRLAPDALLSALFGNQAQFFKALAEGRDERPVAGGGRERSVSQETTFANDLYDFDNLARELRVLVEGLCKILQRENLHAHTVVLKLRTADFRRQTRQRRFSPAGNRFSVLWPLAQALLKEWLDQNPGQRLRLLGAGVRDFATDEQLGLFSSAAKSTGKGALKTALRQH